MVLTAFGRHFGCWPPHHNANSQPTTRSRLALCAVAKPTSPPSTPSLHCTCPYLVHASLQAYALLRNDTEAGYALHLEAYHQNQRVALDIHLAAKEVPLQQPSALILQVGCVVYTGLKDEKCDGRIWACLGMFGRVWAC